MVTEQVIIKFRADGTRVVERDVKRIGTASQQSASSVGFLTKALAALGGTVVLRNAVRTLADFEQQMSTVRAITGATATQFEDLRRKAIELGTATRFSASEAGQGLENLARAGFSVDEALATVETTLKLAQAGALDLGTAAELTASAVRGFRVDVDQAGRFADVLALTAASASTDVYQLGEAMKFVAPAAASLNVPFETASAALGVLGDNALRGTIGGTGLRKVLSTLAKGGPELRKALQSIGLSLADVNVSSVGLVSALEALQKTNLDVGQSFKIFGDRGQPAFDVLVNNIDRLREFNNELDNAGGTVDRIAAIMDDNLNGALLAVRSAYEGLILSFGNLGPTNILTMAVRALASGLRFLADNAEIVAIVLGGLVTVTIPFLITKVNALAAALTANPFGLFLFSIGAATTALISFADRIKVSGDGVTTLADVAKESFEVISSAASELAKRFAESVRALVPEIDLFSREGEVSFKRVAQFAALAADAIVGTFSGAFFAVVTVFQELPTALKNFFFTAVNAAIGALNFLLVSFQRQINALLERLEIIAAQLGKSLNLGRVAIPTADTFDVVGTEFGDLGEIAGEEFKARFFEQTSATDLADRVFKGAEERARARELARSAAESSAREVSGGGGGGGGAEPPDLAGKTRDEVREIDKLLSSLRQENMLLRENGVARDQLAARFDALSALKKDSIDENSEEAKTLISAIEAQVRQNAILLEKDRILQILGPTEEQRVITQEALAIVAEKLNLSLEQQNALLAKLNGNANQSKTFFDGLAGAILAVDTSMVGLGNTIGNLLLRSIDRAAGALSEFLINGARDTEQLKEALSELLRDLAKEIVKVIIQLLIVAALKKVLGADAFSPGVTSVPGRQAGGFVAAGRPVIVGERDPELFIPTSSGRVEPNPPLGRNEPAQVTVVNVTDPKEVQSFLSTTEGEDVIINVIQKRNREVRGLLR